MYKYLAFGLPLILVSLWLGFGQGEKMKLAEKSAANNKTKSIDTLSNVVVSTDKLGNEQDILMEEVVSTNDILQNNPAAPLPVQRKKAAPKKEIKAKANLPEKKDKPRKEDKQKHDHKKHDKSMEHKEKGKPEKKGKEAHPKPVKEKPPAEKPEAIDNPKPKPPKEEKPKPPKEEEPATDPSDNGDVEKPLPDDNNNLDTQSTDDSQSVKSLDEQ